MAEIAFVLKGLTPLVMHNAEMADPDGEYQDLSAELRKKRNKSPEERRDLAKLEFRCGLYFREEIGPGIPDQNLLKCLVEGARAQKLGKEVDAYVSVTQSFVPLDYKGPRTIEAMWDANMWDRRVVSSNGKPGGPKVMRVRPLFKEWGLKFSVQADDEIDPKALVKAMEFAGKRVGLCERLKFRWGRFEVTGSKITN